MSNEYKNSLTSLLICQEAEKWHQAKLTLHYYCVVPGDLRVIFWTWSRFFKRMPNGLLEPKPSARIFTSEAGNEMSSSPTIWLFQLREEIHRLALEQKFGSSFRSLRFLIISRQHCIDGLLKGNCEWNLINPFRLRRRSLLILAIHRTRRSAEVLLWLIRQQRWKYTQHWK